MMEMRKRLAAFTVIGFALIALPLGWAARVGEPAPDFTATDTTGKVHKLSEYQGKFVVLEWTNRGCPYTQKHYNSGNMQRLQREWTGRGVVWLTVISSAPGKQGYVTASEENAYLSHCVAQSMCTDLAEACATGRRDNNPAHPGAAKSAVRCSDADEYTTIRRACRPSSAQIGDHCVADILRTR